MRKGVLAATHGGEERSHFDVHVTYLGLWQSIEPVTVPSARRWSTSLPEHRIFQPNELWATRQAPDIGEMMSDNAQLNLQVHSLIADMW